MIEPCAGTVMETRSICSMWLLRQINMSYWVLVSNEFSHHPWIRPSQFYIYWAFPCLTLPVDVGMGDVIENEAETARRMVRHMFIQTCLLAFLHIFQNSAVNVHRLLLDSLVLHTLPQDQATEFLKNTFSSTLESKKVRYNTHPMHMYKNSHQDKRWFKILKWLMI